MSDSSTVRGADLVARALSAAGVKTIFSLSGNQIMPVYDALHDSGIRIVHVRHEGAAVYMAEGYAQATGQIGVALLTAGPGFANGLSAMYSAKCSETPILVLSGDAPAGQAGKGAFQELAQSDAAGPLCKASLTGKSAQGLQDEILDAIEQAQSGRPGPVHFALPFDLVNQSVTAPADGASGGFVSESPSASELAPIVAALAGAKRPIIIAGPVFCRPDAARLVGDLESATGVPVVTIESPRGLRDPRLGAFAEVLSEADFVLALGKPFDFLVGFGKSPAMSESCRIAQIDIDAGLLARDKAAFGARMVASLEVEPRAAAESLAEATKPSTATAWRDEVKAAIAHRPASWGDIKASSGPLHPVVVGRIVKELLARHPETALVIDGGEFGQWAQACVDAPTRIINGPSGAIGAGIAYAIAAKAADTSRPVVALMGDGTAGFYFMEFETALRENLPFIAIIGNDARWNAEHQIQLRDYGPNRTFACELLPVRYDLVAQGIGCHGEHVKTASELAGALERALASGKPACINVDLDGLAAPVVKRS
ncbi:MAG: thiamine pyrophosphate-binding protein [Hyphomicrobiaceae bacterium]|nr:thiamine pyrophosphate-binding protein [Hyphomicrobiaceae bacterium]